CLATSFGVLHSIRPGGAGVSKKQKQDPGHLLDGLPVATPTYANQEKCDKNQGVGEGATQPRRTCMLHREKIIAPIWCA
ncbi:MAG: hypothetical protein ACO376_08135, partial [Gammaproteobacteria bacterium]